MAVETQPALPKFLEFAALARALLREGFHAHQILAAGVRQFS
jgi:hypothetical protein